MEPTLGDIKLYCESNNIKIDIPPKNNNSQEFSLLKNPEAEAYFQYYIEHSVEISNWFSKKDNSYPEALDFSLNNL